MNETIEAEVRNLLGPGVGEITEGDILGITELALNGMELTDVSDLAAFENLVRLEIKDNHLTDLTPLSGLTKLEVLLAMSDPFLPADQKPENPNTFESMDFIRSLVNLRDIDFTNCGLRDIAFVEDLPNLENANLYCNPIGDITPLRHLPKLRRVTFFDCRLFEIDVFAELPDIKGVAVNQNGVKDLSPLRDCLDLTYLDAHTNWIRDISCLERLTHLSYLTLAGNFLSDISVLAGMPNLTHLTLSLNPYLKDLSVVLEMKQLTHLEVVGLGLTESQKQELSEALPGCDISFDDVA
jgi:Leucine-rich repeat (LRR) protein